MSRPAPHTGATDPWTAAAFAVLMLLLAAAGVLWAAAAVAAVVSGHPVPEFSLTPLARLPASPGDPSAVWGSPMPGPVLYWAVTAAVAGLVLAAALIVWWRWATRASAGGHKRRRVLPGTASPAEVRQVAGRTALLARASAIRPSLTRPRPRQVGYLLGRAHRQQAWATAEDSMLLVGPPRAGKGLHVVIPMILDAPGAVITTSTRPDTLAVTLAARRQAGPVAVFDPQRLAPGVPGGLRWSPVRGCGDPQTAMIRAQGLAAGTGLARGGVEGGDFWQAQTEAVLRGLLHAAALDGRTARDVYRWSLSPVAATEAVTVLTQHTAAADGWGQALEEAAAADARTRDSIWLGVRQALASLADPRVLDAVCPPAGEEFDPATFLTDHGTLYLLGTASGAGAAAPLVAAFIEDMVDTARRLAAASPGARLDPPLLLALDEIGNLAGLPSLPALMSEGGGTGLTTLTVLQSLAQARDKWGEQGAAAIWDAAIVKLILGGGSNARDLQDLSALIGDRDEHTASTTRDAYGGRSTSTSLRRVPIMDPSRLRTLPFGTGVLLLRSAAPILLDPAPWTARRDADQLQTARRTVEQAMRAATSHRTSRTTQ